MSLDLFYWGRSRKEGTKPAEMGLHWSRLAAVSICNQSAELTLYLRSPFPDSGPKSVAWPGLYLSLLLNVKDFLVVHENICQASCVSFQMLFSITCMRTLFSFLLSCLFFKKFTVIINAFICYTSHQHLYWLIFNMMTHDSICWD